MTNNTDRQLIRKVYEGDIISAAGDVVVSFQTDMSKYNETIAKLRRSIVAMKFATRQLIYPDEKDIIDQ